MNDREHSYCYDYGPARGDFSERVFDVVDWNDPPERYQEAIKLFEQGPLQDLSST